jgi:hypothetical protein
MTVSNWMFAHRCRRSSRSLRFVNAFFFEGKNLKTTMQRWNLYKFSQTILSILERLRKWLIWHQTATNHHRERKRKKEMDSVALCWVVLMFHGLVHQNRHRNWRRNAPHARSQIPLRHYHAKCVIHDSLDLLTEIQETIALFTYCLPTATENKHDIHSLCLTAQPKKWQQNKNEPFSPALFM